MARLPGNNAWESVPPPLPASGPRPGSPDSAGLHVPSSIRLRTLEMMLPLGFAQSPPVLLAMRVLRITSSLLVSRRPPPPAAVLMLPDSVPLSSVRASSLKMALPLSAVLPENVLLST